MTQCAIVVPVVFLLNIVLHAIALRRIEISSADGLFAGQLTVPYLCRKIIIALLLYTYIMPAVVRSRFGRACLSNHTNDVTPGIFGNEVV
jgi:hypothetical protein